MPKDIHFENVMRDAAEFERRGDLDTVATLYVNSLVSWCPDHELSPQAEATSKRLMEGGHASAEEVAAFRTAIERLREEPFGGRR